MFRRRHVDSREGLDDVRAVLLGDEEPPSSRDADLRRLTRIAAEAVILQDEAEQLLCEIRDRGELAVLAPRGGRLTSRFCALAVSLPTSHDPLVQQYSVRLREVLHHHALMLSTSLDLLAVAFPSQRLEDELDRIAGLGRPARWLEDIRMELLVEPRDGR
jgi:hypothetical protein